MAVAVPDILARIVGHKRAELAQRCPARAGMERRATQRAPAREFRAALLAHPPAVIAEMKKASPSQGAFTGEYQPANIATSYAEGARRR